MKQGQNGCFYSLLLGVTRPRGILFYGEKKYLRIFRKKGRRRSDKQEAWQKKQAFEMIAPGRVV